MKANSNFSQCLYVIHCTKDILEASMAPGYAEFSVFYILLLRILVYICYKAGRGLVSLDLEVLFFTFIMNKYYLV